MQISSQPKNSEEEESGHQSPPEIEPEDQEVDEYYDNDGTLKTTPAAVIHFIDVDIQKYSSSSLSICQLPAHNGDHHHHHHHHHNTTQGKCEPTTMDYGWIMTQKTANPNPPLIVFENECDAVTAADGCCRNRSKSCVPLPPLPLTVCALLPSEC